MKAIVNRIINPSLVDGPGSRMAIFMQACNMHCLYCHNPETQRMCSSCGDCIPFCSGKALSFRHGKVEYDKKMCIECDSCIRICPNYASPKYHEMDVQKLYGKIRDAADFLDGITVSGGECTLQFEFVAEIFKMVKDTTHLTTLIDTNGTMAYEALQKLCSVTDGFMFDIKCFDRNKHIALTGMDNQVVLDNARYAAQKGKLFEVRTVLVEGYTDDPDEVSGISGFIKEISPDTRFKLIPFRPMGVKGIMADYPSFDKQKYLCLYQTAYEILGDRVVKTRL